MKFAEMERFRRSASCHYLFKHEHMAHSISSVIGADLCDQHPVTICILLLMVAFYITINHVKRILRFFFKYSPQKLHYYNRRYEICAILTRTICSNQRGKKEHLVILKISFYRIIPLNLIHIAPLKRRNIYRIHFHPELMIRMYVN